MKSGIYYIKCKTNNKIYIGSAKNIKYRFSRHKNDLKKHKHHSPHLQRAWNLYGENSFEFGIIENCNIEEMEIRENHWINLFKSYKRKFGFNILKNSKTRLGLVHSIKTKKKISKNNFSRGKFYENSVRGSKQVFQYSLNGFFIKKWNSLKEPSHKLKITYQNISKCVLGERTTAGNFIWLAEFKGEKISAHEITKSVVQLTINNEFIKEYKNITEIKQQNPNFTVQCIWSVCNKKRKTCYGYKWIYKNEYERFND